MSSDDSSLGSDTMSSGQDRREAHQIGTHEHTYVLTHVQMDFTQL